MSSISPQNEALNRFLFNPKNYLLAPALLIEPLSNCVTFPFSAFFAVFAFITHGAYVDIAHRSVHTALDYCLTDRITPYIKPLGEVIRRVFRDSISPRTQNLNPDALLLIQAVLLPFYCGLDPENPLGDKELVRTALSAVALVTALFTVSTLTGVGGAYVLPLFWAYQNIRFYRGVLTWRMQLAGLISSEDHKLDFRVYNAFDRLRHNAINRLHLIINQLGLL